MGFRLKFLSPVLVLALLLNVVPALPATAALAIVKTNKGVYIGRTMVQGVERVAQHSKGYYELTEKQISGAKFFDTTGMSLRNQRKFEQQLIKDNGGIDALANRINSIAEKLWPQFGVL